jgi:hypothetical protein
MNEEIYPSILSHLGPPKSSRKWVSTMKNIQVIDGAENCSYDMLAMTDDEFRIPFPAPAQDIDLIEDAIDHVGDDELGAIMRNVGKRPIKKPDVDGIHGTLFYELLWKKRYYPNKRDDDIER